MVDSKVEYAIVDVETSGSFRGENKITEIAIIITDGESILDEYSSLVNPEKPIDPYVIGLTGITNEMVADEPKFYEIAKKVFQLLDNRVFVAHNVAFDANVIKDEFHALGAKFLPKKLCTVQLGRKVFPGYKSYSLGNLCESLGIPLNDRHRAMGDTQATYLLFQKILQEGKDHVEEALAARTKVDSIPPNMDREQYDNLPQATGVYYLKNKDGEIIYIGKAKNIKKRIQSHFNDKKNKTRYLNFRNAISSVDYELTGSELVALLLESAEIKKHQPKFNRAQRRISFKNALYQYFDKKGYNRLAVCKISPNLGEPLYVYSNLNEARSHLTLLAKKHQLCPKLCGLQKSTHACFDYQLKACNGACIGEEAAQVYNEKVDRLIYEIKNFNRSFVIIDKGRSLSEKSIILIEDGIYKGYGFLDKNETIDEFHDFKSFITPQGDNRDIQRIIQMYLKKNRPKIIEDTSKSID